MKLERAVNFLAAIFVIISSVNAVDRNKFRTCQQSSFCRRCRGMEPGQTIYSLDPATLQQVNSAQAEALIIHGEDRLRMEVSALKVAGFRVKIREAFPLVARFEVPEVLVAEPELDKMSIQKSEDDKGKLEHVFFYRPLFNKIFRRLF